MTPAWGEPRLRFMAFFSSFLKVSPTMAAVFGTVILGFALSFFLPPLFTAWLWPLFGLVVVFVYRAETGRKTVSLPEPDATSLLETESAGRPGQGDSDRLAAAQDQLRLARERLGQLELVSFRFTEAVEFSTLSLTNSEAFVRDQVQDVISGFRDLGKITKQIEVEISKTFERLLDPNTPQTLGALVSDAQLIDGELKDFFSGLGRLQERNRGYTKANAKELERISEMAATIEEFFENIRMISLNLSIEAARAGTGSIGKALQVLAQKLREFSDRAQEISVQQKSVVDGARKAEMHLEAEMSGGFSAIMKRIPSLQEKLDAFPKVISVSHSQLDELGHEIAELSETIRSVLEKKIGTLQFQDLTRQENEHLIELLSALNRTDLKDSAGSPPPASRENELLEIAKDFNDRATTSNERKVLLEWLDRHGLPHDRFPVKGSEREAGSIELF